MLKRIALIAVVLVAFVSLLLWGLDQNHHQLTAHRGHGDHGMMPVEGGQAAFSALIEMVSLLENNQNTDWASVSIDALRSHLRDMHRVVMETQATTDELPSGGLQYRVLGEGAALEALHRMVPMHASVIAESRGWQISTTPSSVGVVVDIKNLNEQQTTRLNALGFYGFMSLDAHHQAHHYQMATGQMHH